MCEICVFERLRGIIKLYLFKKNNTLAIIINFLDRLYELFYN